MSAVSIVIPVYNALDDTKRCVESLYACRTEIAFEVILVDNGSDDDVVAWMGEQRKSRANLRPLRFDEPMGFAPATNAGVRQARHELIVLLNSDTIVTDDWLDKLAAALSADAALGIVSPVTNRCGGLSAQRDEESRMLAPEETQGYARQIEARREMVFEPQRLVFFCVMMRRSLWDQLAGLDEIFRAGNFEDDDFCLRARMLGYRMAVVRNVFVFHDELKTYTANGINAGERLASTQLIFAARVRRLSIAARPAVFSGAVADHVSVIVPVVPERANGLRDSLASLVNQTVRGFEVVVVHPAGLDISEQASEFEERLKLTLVAADDDLWNAGLVRAEGTTLAYLPAGDIYYPFHLEALLDALHDDVQAVYSAWSVAVDGRRAWVEFHEAQPGLELGDWAPIVCWMHRRSDGARFDPTLGVFSSWGFILAELRKLQPVYRCRVTCERRPDVSAARDADDAERVMAQFPVQDSWQQSQRQRFLDGVREGAWEDRLIITHNERARRARNMMKKQAPARVNPKELTQLRSRLADAASRAVKGVGDVGKPAIFLFGSIEWTALTQRPHHFAEGLATRGHRVFWVDVHLRAPERVDSGTLLRELKPGIFQVDLPGSPGAIYQLAWSSQIVETMVACFDYIRAAHGITSALQLVNFPRWQPLVAALHERFGWPVAYDCLDDQQAFAGLYGHTLGDYETSLLASSAAVIASGSVLCESIRRVRPDAVLIPNAVDFELFHSAQSDGSLDHLPRPIVGFFGSFADWLDLDWIQAAARRFPGWSFVYIGREGFAAAVTRQRWKAIAAIPNIHIFPQAEPEKLAAYLAQFDICTMPFRDIPITRSMNAVKLYEYLAAGKPVLATQLPETELLRAIGIIATYDNHEQSFSSLEDALAELDDEADIAKRQRFAADNTWHHRVELLCSALGESAWL